MSLTAHVDSDRKQNSPRSASSLDAATVAAAIALAILVVWTGPFHGWLLCLDSTPGPHAPYPASLWGGGGYNSSLPYALLFAWLLHNLGSIASWIPLAASLILAFTGAARLVPGTRSIRLTAALLFTVNPIMYERIWVGQFGYLVGYALLPWFLSSVWNARDERGLRSLRPVLIWAVMVGSSVHFLWVGAVTVIAVAACSRINTRTLTWTLSLVVGIACTSAYLWPAGTSGESATAVGASDLAVFATRGDPTYGLYVNVLALYGFWREGSILPKDQIAGWPFFLVAILFVIIVGAVSSLRDKERRERSITIALIGACGFVLALGTQGPFGDLYRWAYETVPGFGVMREPQKFIALLALAYTWFFAEGIITLVKGLKVKSQAVLVLGACVLLVAYVPTLFFGLRGELQASTIPKDWQQADAAIGNGNGKVLALPWHQYLAFGFTDGRVIGNLSDALLRRDAISGDNTELSGLSDTSSTRSRYIQFLLQSGRSIRSFGAHVRPLGVEYIAVAKTVDYRTYEWLNRQSDLQLVQDTPSVLVYRNLHAQSNGYRGPLVTVADWGEAVGFTEANPDVNAVVVAKNLQPGPFSVPSVSADLGQVSAPTIHRTRTASEIPQGAGAAALPATFDPSWTVGDTQAIQLASGTTGFVQTEGGTAELRHWSKFRSSYVISISATVVLCVAQIRRRKPSQPAADLQRTD